MKIHRIETVNLNSLYGELEVDLAATLGDASLFLIFGPTGSGKSTLMDAVSLALFGKTPRLNAEQGNQAADPRAIMSRGTGQCSARVMFSKIEEGARQKYRARWTCNRAYKKPDGARQAANRSMERLAPDGGWELLVSDHRYKVYGPVFDKVLEGFGVKDFNRSMLLAQGQFDAFLGAPADQRAEILERLTDTSIYQRIGARAARLQSRHSSRLTALRTLAAAGGGLAAGALAELEETHKQNTEKLQEQRQVHELAEERLKWFSTDVELREKLAKAVEQQSALDADYREAEEALNRLAEHERCEEKKAFQLFDKRGIAREAVKKLEKQLHEIDSSLPALVESATDKKILAAAAETSERLAAWQLEILRPLAACADKADLELAAAHKLAAETAELRRTADAQVVETEQELTKATAAVTDARTKAAAAKTDLEAHAADGELASHWGPIRTRLDQLISSDQGLGKDAKTLAQREKDLEGDRADLARDRKTQDTSHTTILEPLEQAVESTKEALLALQSRPEFEASRKGAVEEVEQAKTERDLIQAAVAPVTAQRKAAAELEATRAQIEATTAELNAEQKTLHELELGVAHCKELEGQAQAALERTQRVAALVVHRASLVDGEPCLLCGSKVHPWQGDPDQEAADATINETLTAAEGALKDTQKAHEDAEQVHRDAEVETQKLSARLELLNEQKSSAAQQQPNLDRAATAALEAILLPLDSSTEDVEEARGRAAHRLGEAEKTLTTLDEAQRDVDRAGRLLRETKESQKEAEATLRDRGAKLQERGKLIDTARVEHTEAQKTSAAERDACRALLKQHGLIPEGEEPAGWRDLGDQRREEHIARVNDVADLEALVGTTAATQKGKQDLLAEHKSQLDTLIEKLLLMESDRDEKRELASQAREALDQAWREVLAADDARPTEELPPDSSSPALLLEAQKTWVQRTEEAAETAAEKLLQASKVLNEARTRRQTLAEGRPNLEDASGLAEAALADALAALALEGDAALLALRLEDEQLTDLRQQRKKLADSKLEIETCIRERREMVEAHAGTRPEALAEEPELDALIAVVADAKALLEEADETHQATGASLRAHHLAVQEQADNQRALQEAEQEARVWQTLHQYIGVNDGGKFKQFAQALNLGQLLDKANVHLRRLSKRYRLIPHLDGGLPTLEFDLSDLWQVGERVATRSLSGGERFLVSLSLALGLSDFRAVKMPIETLLLDEGFGTLDPETLGVALAALSQLQADGRQVGIISHVVGLQERIEARIEVRPLGGGRSGLHTVC